jgi:GGDEF domain-containing protein
MGSFPRDHSRALAVFAQADSALLAPYGTSFAISLYDSFEAWKAAPSPPKAFLIEHQQPRDTNELLRKIRQDSEAFASLCFVGGARETFDAGLADGEVPPPAVLMEKIAGTADLEASFRSRDAGSRQERLLKYLWLRPDFVLEPQHEWRHARYYRYPLLEALSGESDGFDWLQSLFIARLLEPVKLLDRQRECAFCRSAHLSFVDICPNCHDIDIDKRASLHCFTCGYVDAQEKFLNNGILVCPKCDARLRHIGSDYDRPIESYGCRQCGFSFVEGEVQARCASCDKKMTPEELVTHAIHSWRLSERGRIIAIRGEAGDLFSPFDELNFVSNELFKHHLDWLLTQIQRYSDIRFSLLGLYFRNLPELAAVLGHARVLQWVEAFAQRLRQILRSPDLSTRTAENMIWLLLPHTDEQGLKGLQARIESSVPLAQQPGNLRLDWQFFGIPSSRMNVQETAELLLARLRSELL